MKHLIVCSDGSWNTPDQEDNGVPAPSNVVKLRNCLSERAPAQGGGRGARRAEQRAYYHTGVGTEGGLLSRTAGGAWGQGLSKNIQSAYHWLARNYAPGDRLYLFGFSRGAYTVRSLGGLLNKCGLPDLTDVGASEGWHRIEAVYEQGYRDSQPRRAWARDWAFHHEREAPVRFLGVWDTVGALGIPDDLAVLNLLDRRKNWRFHDTRLGANVEVARHALALDEIRASFTPTLWTDVDEGRDVRQVWFPGSHADVGGGYAQTGLSDGALAWMIEEASAAGLGFEAGMVKQIAPDARGVLHDSYKGVFKAHRSRPRNTPPIDDGAIHASALERHRTPPVSQGPYRPTRVLGVGDSETVAVFAREHWNATTLFLEPGSYDFEAHGEWVDASIACGPAGARDGRFEPGEVAHVIGSLLGHAETAWGRVTGNERADFKMTRRYERAPWFALMGTVVNCKATPTPDGTPAQHRTFRIGARKSGLTLERGGYLYAWANDAWDFYGNNAGSVELTVTRRG